MRVWWTISQKASRMSDGTIPGATQTSVWAARLATPRSIAVCARTDQSMPSPSICRIVALSSSVVVSLAQAKRRHDSREGGIPWSTLSPFKDGLPHEALRHNRQATFTVFTMI